MYAVRFGSYSIAATLAGTPSLLRLKSILRYRRLAPPPRWREVLRPLELRPPGFVSPSTSGFSGCERVISAKSGYETNRRPGEVGFGLRIGIWLLPGLERLEDRDRVALAHLHDGLLPRPRASGVDAAALGLGLDRRGPHRDHLDVEHRLDGLTDLRLMRVIVHAEGVLAGIGQHVGLLGHDRADDHLTGVHHASLASSDAPALVAR